MFPLEETWGHTLRLPLEHGWHNCWRTSTIKHPPTPSRPPAAPALQCGPRFEMKLYQIKLGTMDQLHAENEWALRSYVRR